MLYGATKHIDAKGHWIKASMLIKRPDEGTCGWSDIQKGGLFFPSPPFIPSFFIPYSMQSEFFGLIYVTLK